MDWMTLLISSICLKISRMRLFLNFNPSDKNVKNAVSNSMTSSARPVYLSVLRDDPVRGLNQWLPHNLTPNFWLVEFRHLRSWLSFLALEAESLYIRVPIFKSKMQGFSKCRVRSSRIMCSVIVELLSSSLQKSQTICLLTLFHIVWKLLKMSHLNFGIFHQFLSY